MPKRERVSITGSTVPRRFAMPSTYSGAIGMRDNTGCRMIFDSGRPPPPVSSAVGLGTFTRDCTASAITATPASTRNEPRNGVANRSFAKRDDSGPRKPPTMPPASTSEIAFALNAGSATSAAANRYCRPNAV